MTATTYFTAMGVEQNESGFFVAVDAIQVLSANDAIEAAQRLAHTHMGAVAFSRQGDLESGEFADAVELAKFGELPDDLSSIFA
ncbi:MAG: hypothetical protein NXI02_30265 [Rhodobacteraceae bacterium]|nr:hypothetical protein [Paracoccaceae bacterium]